MDNRIYRSRETKMLAGVCGGIADMFNIDPTLVRLVAVALTIFSGFTFLLVYFLCAIIIPLEPSPGYLLRRNRQPEGPANSADRGTANAVAPTAAKEEPAVSLKPEPIQTIEEDRVEEAATEEPKKDHPTDTEITADKAMKFRNDETVINSQADKY